MNPKSLIPWSMAATRAALGPILIAAVRANWSPIALAGIVIAALLSDIFDGILARRWHTDTAALRLSDTLADTAFYFCTGIALWVSHPALLRANSLPLLTLLAAEALKFTFDIAKYGKPASYHSYLAKSWGLVLAATIIAILAAAPIATTLLPIALWVGVACNLQDICMTAILPTWQRDIKTIPAALRLRLDLIANAKLSGTTEANAWAEKTPCPIHRALVSGDEWVPRRS